MSIDDKAEDPDHSFPYKTWLHAVRSIVDEPIAPGTVVPDPPIELLDWLFLGPMSCLQDLSKLKSLGITHIISTNRMPPSQVETLYWDLRSNGFDHTVVEAEDNVHYDLLGKHWKECQVVFESVATTPASKVFVHCLAGMNRSGTLVAAAMMNYGKISLVATIRRLKEKRGRVITNSAFQRQLVMFASELNRLGEEPTGFATVESSPYDSVSDNSSPTADWLEMFTTNSHN